VIEIDIAIKAIKDAIKKSYGSKGDKVIAMNNAAVDAALDKSFQVTVPAKATSTKTMPPAVPANAPEFVQDVTGEILAGRGDSLPVSKMPADGRLQAFHRPH